jgi:hypothetical protein
VRTLIAMQPSMEMKREPSTAVNSRRLHRRQNRWRYPKGHHRPRRLLDRVRGWKRTYQPCPPDAAWVLCLFSTEFTNYNHAHPMLQAADINSFIISSYLNPRAHTMTINFTPQPHPSLRSPAFDLTPSPSPCGRGEFVGWNGD